MSIETILNHFRECITKAGFKPLTSTQEIIRPNEMVISISGVDAAEHFTGGAKFYVMVTVNFIAKTDYELLEIYERLVENICNDYCIPESLNILFDGEFANAEAVFRYLYTIYYSL